MKFLVADVVRHVFNDEEDGGPVTWDLTKMDKARKMGANKWEICSELSVACIVTGSPLYKCTLSAH